MFKKIIMTMLVISIMVIGTTSLAVANTETENYSYSMKASRDEISEPFSSRWYRQDVVIYENKQGTRISDDGLRKVEFTQTKIAVYNVYVGNPDKRIHVHDKYYTVWTGYKRDTKPSPWKVVPDMVEVSETTIDRGPIIEIFGMLMH